MNSTLLMTILWLRRWSSIDCNRFGQLAKMAGYGLAARHLVSSSNVSQIPRRLTGIKVQEALWQIDPASVAHLDPDGRQLRVNIQTDAGELLALLQSIDLPVDASDITQIPSICCGGCGG